MRGSRLSDGSPGQGVADSYRLNHARDSEGLLLVLAALVGRNAEGKMHADFPALRESPEVPRPSPRAVLGAERAVRSIPWLAEGGDGEEHVLHGGGAILRPERRPWYTGLWSATQTIEGGGLGRTGLVQDRGRSPRRAAGSSTMTNKVVWALQSGRRADSGTHNRRRTSRGNGRL